MAVFRVERNTGYTVMSNHHLRNKELTLKAKGLLSQMLSLPEDWDYTLAGLSYINRESIDAIRTAVWELEKTGYITRRQGRDEKGKMTAIEYTIYEQPQSPGSHSPGLENPTPGKPILENPIPGNPTSENPTQLNKDISKTNLPNKEKSNTDLSSTHSIPIHSLNPLPYGEGAAEPPEKKRTERNDAYRVYEEIIKDNIDYDILIQDKLKEITDRLEQGIMELFDSDRYKEYLRVMSKFHNYSFNNTLLIAMQKPDASLVAGFQSWKNNFKRNVVKGEKGIKILAPSPFKIRQEMEKIDPATQKPVIGADGKPVKEEKEITIPAFKVVSVFDVSQTEGKELPDIAVDMLTGDVECFKDVFAALEKTSPVPIGFEKIEGNSHGYYHLEEKRIAIDEGMSELQTIKTAIHEIAHAKLHDIDPNAPKEERAGRPDRRTREVQAESVAYAVCQHYGLDTSDYSFGYVAGWSSGRELDELKSSLETIRSTAAEIINSIDEHLQEIQKERDKEQAQKGTTIEAAEPDKDTFSIYQLKRGDETRDFRFEPYDRLAATGHTAEQTNYDLIYTAELAPGTSLEDIYTRFNIDHPKDFKGHSLSVSDVVVLHQNGQDTAHYVDSSGYRQVPEFLQPPEKENPLKHVEDTIEQNDNHFDGIINNTPSVDELEKKAKSGEQISLTDLADAIKAEKTHGNLYELDYARHYERVKDKELAADTVRLIYEHGTRDIPAGQYFAGNPDTLYGKFERFEAIPNDPDALRFLLQEEKHSREQLAPGDFKAHIAVLHDGLIETEARRIVAEMKRRDTPNSPNRTHFMVELSNAFMQLANSKDLDRLFSMLPYQTLSFSKIEGKHGTYALIDKNESRNKDIRKLRPSIRAQLQSEKEKAVPKRTAKVKKHDLEV